MKNEVVNNKTENIVLDKQYGTFPNEPLDEMNQLPKYICSFRRICFIGDSLTKGAFNYNEDGEDESIDIEEFAYTNIISKLTGVECINYSISGIRASTESSDSSWLYFAELNGWLNVENSFDVYVIALGVNDINWSKVGNINTDINKKDYTNNEQTFVGGYSAIIQRIQEINPEAKIFCTTIPCVRDIFIGGKGSIAKRIEINNCIRSISELYQVYVLDLEQNAETTPEEIKYFQDKYMNGSHYNALGHSLRARQLIAYVDWIIENNPDDFQDIQFIGSGHRWDDID